MYDTKSEANEFVGDSQEEAVANACRFFGVEESELKVAVPDQAEIYGLGARIVVVAVPANATPPAPDDGGGRRDRGDRGGRDRDRGRGRDRDRGRGRGRDRDRERGRGDDSPSTNTDREKLESSSIAEEETSEQPVGESKGVVEGPLDEVGQYLLGIVERMKLGGFRISGSEEGDFVVYELRGEAAATLGAGDGRGVEALQLLGNQAAMRQSEDPPRIVVDADGNAERRTTFLEKLADRAIKRSRETKRSVALDPMNAKDRRILHMAVKEVEGAATMSVGTGRYRQVVVVPEGSPEYEEALESSSRTSES